MVYGDEQLQATCILPKDEVWWTIALCTCGAQKDWLGCQPRRNCLAAAYADAQGAVGARMNAQELAESNAELEIAFLAEYTQRFYCLECETTVALDYQGRCPHCQGERLVVD